MASHMTVWLLVTFARQGHWQHCCCPLPDLRCSGLVLVSELSDGCLTLKMTLLGHEWKAVVEIFDQIFFSSWDRSQICSHRSQSISWDRRAVNPPVSSGFWQQPVVLRAYNRTTVTPMSQVPGISSCLGSSPQNIPRRVALSMCLVNF